MGKKLFGIEGESLVLTKEWPFCLIPSFASGDRQNRRESGQHVKVNDEESNLVIEGEYSYVGDDGRTYVVRYIADENGFRPLGDHLPKLPFTTTG